MAQIAQREIERIEGLPYGQIGLRCGGSGQASCPANSTDPTNPNYYVSSDGTKFQYDRSTPTATEPFDVDATNGTIVPSQSWSEVTQGGKLSGSFYDFVTWSTDSQCSPGCPSSNDYKRVTVAVTLNQSPACATNANACVHPDPVYVTSVISDPNAGRQIPDPPKPVCIQPTGTTGPCNITLNGATYFLHDWPATLSGIPPAPAGDSLTHDTVGITTGGPCTPTQSLAGTPADVAGCPIPDLMDLNPPAGDALTPLYNYSSDLCPDSGNCYPGGREVQATGTGTGSAADCTNGAWGTLLNNASEFWVTPKLSSAATLTGSGGLTIYTQTVNPGGTAPSPPPVVTFCVEIYDVPNETSVLGSLADILAWPPVPKGGASYVATTQPSGGNWPTQVTQTSFLFTFSAQTVTIPQNDRIGLRVWEYSEPGPAAPIDLIYDNPTYPSQLQLNTP
jgi:hypothetical protein